VAIAVYSAVGSGEACKIGSWKPGVIDPPSRLRSTEVIFGTAESNLSERIGFEHKTKLEHEPAYTKDEYPPFIALTHRKERHPRRFD
jgi:hypothetical protein